MQHLIIERGINGDRKHLSLCDQSAKFLQAIPITDGTATMLTTLLRELGVLGKGDSILGWDSHSTPAEREQQAAAVPPGAQTYHDLCDARDRFKKEVTELLNERCGRLPDEMAWRMLCNLREWITGKIERITVDYRGNGDHSS